MFKRFIIFALSFALLMPPNIAAATSITLTGAGGLTVAANASISLVANKTSADGSGPGSSVTYTGVSLGASCNSKVVLVGVVWVDFTGSPNSISSMTVDGISATQVVNYNVSPEHAAFWIASGVTNTSGTIALTFNSGQGNSGIFVYRLCDAQTTATQTNTSSSGNPASSLTLNIAAGGVAASIAIIRVTSATFTWGGLTKDADQTTIVGTHYSGAASGAFATVQTGLTITATASTSGIRNVVMAAASFPKL